MRIAPDKQSFSAQVGSHRVLTSHLLLFSTGSKDDRSKDNGKAFFL
jgi:hypothetical protein